MMSTHQQLVALFLRRARHELPATPTYPSERIRLLQARLLLEETLEAVAAFGIDPLILLAEFQGGIELARKRGVSTFEPSLDLAALVKELCDVRVVATGSLCLAGVEDGAVQGEVDHNNLLKIANGTFRDDGKFCKDPNHPKPDLHNVLQSLTTKESPSDDHAPTAPPVAGTSRP